MTCGVQCITCKVWIAFKDVKEHVRVKNDIEQRSVESIKNLVVLISLKRLICTRSHNLNILTMASCISENVKLGFFFFICYKLHHKCITE